jgi:hypothetical protein
MKRLVAACFVVALSGSVALAGQPPKQNHHCKLPDGSMDMAKTKKECKAAKGTWAKDAAGAAAEAKPGAEKPAEPPPAPAK